MSLFLVVEQKTPDSEIWLSDFRGNTDTDVDSGI